MKKYTALARHYDDFTADVPYTQWLAYFLRIFEINGISPKLILDLACGTGTIASLLSRKGYEVIGADASEDMLTEAYGKPVGPVPPIFICQSMERLDLFGTVDATLCCLDSVNYLATLSQVEEVFQRVFLFMNPDGIFIFDILNEKKLARLDGIAFTRENNRTFCVYQADYEAKARLLTYTVDIFEQVDKLYRRITEQHRERAYTIDELRSLLELAGFDRIMVYGELSLAPPDENAERIFITARKPAGAEGTKVPRE